MSNQNQKNPAENGGNGTPAPEPAAKEKKTLTQRILHVRDKVMASKAGRIAVRGLKAVGVGGIAFLSYKAGAKSVKPTTIYIREGVTEEEEKPVEEPQETEEKPAEETEAE